jgi:hypothetical protein
MDRSGSEPPRSPGVRRALRLLAAEPLAPLAPPDELLGRVVRRPGELHDALPLSREAAGWLAREAASQRLSTDVLGTVLLEAALAAGDVGDERFARMEPPDPPLDGGCGRMLSAAEAAYLRTLTIARRSRPSHPAPAPAVIAVPVRIAGRLAEVDVAGALSAVRGEAAIEWETAALIEGRTLAECVLLRASQVQPHSAEERHERSTAARSSPSKSAS